MANQLDVNPTLALNVMNKLREMSRGEHGVTSQELADAILLERVKRPTKGLVNEMRAQVYSIIKVHFPHATAATKLTLGIPGGHAPHKPTSALKVHMIDRDMLMRDLISFVRDDLGAYDLMPEELRNRITEWEDQK